MSPLMSTANILYMFVASLMFGILPISSCNNNFSVASLIPGIVLNNVFKDAFLILPNTVVMFLVRLP